MPHHNNILVIRLSSLGDVLMSMPAVKAIRDQYPAAHISWLVEGSVAEFLSHQTFIDEVIPFPRGKLQRAIKGGRAISAAQETGAFMRLLRSRDYDTVLDFHGIIKSALLSVCVRGGARRIGFGKVFAKEQSHLFYHERLAYHDRRIHKVDRNLLISRNLGTEGVPEVPLDVPAEAKEYVDAFLSSRGVTEGFVVINPFSSKGSEFKRWSIPKYADLARRIRQELGKKIIVLWGPGEREEALELVNGSGEGVFLACETNISQLFALLRRAEMYVGGDTGVMHLATFAKVRVVAIFGPTDPRINGPYGPLHSMVRRGLSCSPCKNKDCKGRECLEDITVEDVFKVVRRMSEGGTDLKS
jgi:heptosyltransferase I